MATTPKSQYNEPPTKGDTAILGNGSGAEGWGPHHIDRPLLEKHQDSYAFGTSPAEVKQIGKPRVQPLPEQIK